MRRLLLALLAGLALAPSPERKVEAASGAAGDLPREPAEFTKLGSGVLFSAATASGGRELWRTDDDGAPALVADLVPGRTGSDPGSLVALDDRVFFAAGDGVHRRLWATDGTAAGTAPARLFPDEDLLDFSLLGAVPGVLSVVTRTSELWQSDGTSPATLVLSRAERCRGSACGFAVLRAHGGALYAVSYAKSGTSELWRVDSAGAATKLLEGFGRFVGDVPGGLVFTGVSGPLWLAEAAGARQVSPLDAQFGASGDSAALGRALLFAGRDAAGVELWRTDGTSAGTHRVLELAPGPDGGEPFDFVAAGERVFFLARDGAALALWVTDGTASGTRPLVSGAETFTRPVALGALILFGAAVGGSAGLWRSDGTLPGTELLAPLATPVPWLWRAGDAVYFAGDTGSGLVPWRSDGTPGGTRALSRGDVATGAPSAGGGCGAARPGTATAGWLAILGIASRWRRLGRRIHSASESDPRFSGR